MLILVALLSLTPLAAPQDRQPLPAPVLETFTVTADYHVATAYTKPRPPAPGVTIEFGVGLKNESPRYRDSPVLHRATSDEQGLVHVEFEVPIEWKTKPSTWIWARIATPGLRELTRMRGLNAKDEPTFLGAYSGVTVYGVVRDSEGDPVAGSRVGMFPRGSDRGMYCTTDERGRYAVGAYKDGTNDLHAHASGIGACTLSMEVNTGTALPDVELTLEKGRSLEVRVIDPGREPVAGMWVVAIPSGLERAPSLGNCIELERNGGLASGTGRTDENGRLVLAGLRDGEYQLTGTWSRNGDERFGSRKVPRGESLGRAVVGASSKPAELISRQHRIELKVIDAEGAPIPMVTQGEGEAKTRGYPMLIEAVGGDTSRFWRNWINHYGVGDHVFVEAEPGTTYRFTYLDGAYAYKETLVSVPPDHYRIPVEIQLGPRAGPGFVEPLVLDPSGVEYGSVQYRVFAADSNRELEQVPFPPIASTSGEKMEVNKPPIRLQPGRYILEVNTDYQVEGSGICAQTPAIWPRSPHVPARVSIEVVAGETLSPLMQLGIGGYLDLESASPDAQPRPYHDQASYDEARAESKRHVLSLTTLDGSETITRLMLAHLIDTWPTNWVPIHSSARGTTPIPPGVWILRINNAVGEQVLQERIAIRANEVTTVHW